MSHCPLTQNQLYVHSSGEVYACSFLQNKPEHILGHIAKNSLKEIWEGSRRKQLVQKHQEGSLPDYCKIHQEKFLCHKIGNQYYFDTLDTPKRLDIMLDSACNLKCIMCTNIYDRTGGLKEDFFWNNNDDFLSQIQEIELVGGEPLISPYFPRLVEKVKRINPKCRWFATTNAHYELTHQMIELFKEVNFDSLSISVDSLKKETFEKIRVRSQFEKVMNNILLIKKLVRSLQINTVIQLDNYQELVDIYKWSKENELRFYPILLQYPDQYSLQYLDLNIKKDWILKLMEDNLTLKSKDLFFFIKKFISLDPVKSHTEVKLNYLRQLEILGELYRD